MTEYEILVKKLDHTIMTTVLCAVIAVALSMIDVGFFRNNVVLNWAGLLVEIIIGIGLTVRIIYLNKKIYEQ